MDTETLYFTVLHYMPVLMHKLLIHAIIIKHTIISIDQLSENVQEANHKYFKNYRENHSWKSNNEDIYLRIC